MTFWHFSGIRKIIRKWFQCSETVEFRGITRNSVFFCVRYGNFVPFPLQNVVPSLLPLCSLSVPPPPFPPCSLSVPSQSPPPPRFLSVPCQLLPSLFPSSFFPFTPSTLSSLSPSGFRIRIRMDPYKFAPWIRIQNADPDLAARQ
jgi:hypothetical protein